MDQVLLATLIILICVHCLDVEGKLCKSIDVKHERELYQLRECVTVLGHVSLTNFRIHHALDVISNVEEITDYLLVYRIEELNSLETFFPNLTIIRGNKQLFDKYSLVVYENRNLRDLGLKSLLKIRRGSIRIESNPVLCFSDTVNWVYLVEDPLTQHYSINNNLNQNDCPVCSTNISVPESGYFKKNCWNLKHFQLKTPPTYHDKCPPTCGNYGCEKNGQCCSSLCLTGCSAEKCRICRNYKNLHGDCVEFCSIPNYTYLDKCIPEKACRKKEWIPHGGACIQECPKSFQQDFLMGDASCSVNCRHNYTIRSKDDLEDIKECVTVKGYIHIELRDDKSISIGDLENALGEIKEIVGYLKITKTPQLVSLAFFKKLDTIKGDQLVDGEYSLYIVNNDHLEEIWPENHKVALLNGRLFIHMNPRLCFEKIMQLAPSMKSDDVIRVKDASPSSNGELVNCGEQFVPIHPIVEAVNATAARIKVDPVSASYIDIILGYKHFYKEAPNRNITKFDGMHGCGRDNWQMQMTLDLNVRHVLRNLKPNTQYAFFVKTISHVDEHRGTSWQSNIQYFKTLSMKPGPIVKLYAAALSAHEIIIHWWPPKNPNGIIDRYLLRYENLNLRANFSHFRGYSEGDYSGTCECEFDRSNRGPQPSEFKFYNRQQNFVETALPNILYISSNTIKLWEEEMRREDETRRKRDTSGSPANKLETQEEEIRINPTDDEEAQQEKFRQYQLLMERNALMKQDTGVAGYQIKMPMPLCAITNPSERYQKYHNCEPVEHYSGIEIPGTNYSYTLSNLPPKTVYRVYVRACVQGIENGCGAEKSVVVETVSKELEILLDNSKK